MKILIWSLHPIMYQTPIFRELSKQFSNNDGIHVVFGSDLSLRKVYFSEINTEFKPDTPNLLSEYSHSFARNFTTNDRKGYFSRVNLGLIKTMWTYRPNVLLIHGYETFTSWYLVYLSILFNLKVVWRGEATMRSTASTIRMRFKKFILKNLFFSFIDVVYYSCKGNKDYLIDIGVGLDKMYPMDCCVDNHYFQAEHLKLSQIRNEIRHSLNINDHDLVFTFSCRMTRRKNCQILLKSLATNVHKERCVVLFVGDGPELENLINYSKQNNIRYRSVGHVNQTEISKYYCITDIFCILSSYDPSPKALNEMMNFRVPIIVSTEVGTAQDLVLENINGFLVNADDDNKISSIVNDILDEKYSLQEMGNESLNIVNQKTLKNAVTQFLTPLRESIK